MLPIKPKLNVFPIQSSLAPQNVPAHSKIMQPKEKYNREWEDFRMGKENSIAKRGVILPYFRRLNKNISFCEHIARTLVRILEGISASEGL